LDLTAQEIRLEMLYPADEAIHQLCQSALLMSTVDCLDQALRVSVVLWKRMSG
jgi:hypothetical protein